LFPLLFWEVINDIASEKVSKVIMKVMKMIPILGWPWLVHYSVCQNFSLRKEAVGKSRNVHEAF